MRVYPTPATDAIYLDLQEDEHHLVTLLTLAGRVVAAGKYSGRGVKGIGVSNLAGGLYILKVEGAVGKMQIFRIAL